MAFVLRAMHWTFQRILYVELEVPTLQASFGAFLATGERPERLALAVPLALLDLVSERGGVVQRAGHRHEAAERHHARGGGA